MSAGSGLVHPAQEFGFRHIRARNSARPRVTSAAARGRSPGRRRTASTAGSPGAWCGTVTTCTWSGGMCCDPHVQQSQGCREPARNQDRRPPVSRPPRRRSPRRAMPSHPAVPRHLTASCHSAGRKAAKFAHGDNDMHFPPRSSEHTARSACCGLDAASSSFEMTAPVRGHTAPGPARDVPLAGPWVQPGSVSGPGGFSRRSRLAPRMVAGRCKPGNWSPAAASRARLAPQCILQESRAGLRLADVHVNARPPGIGEPIVPDGRQAGLRP